MGYSGKGLELRGVAKSHCVFDGKPKKALKTGGVNLAAFCVCLYSLTQD